MADEREQFEAARAAGLKARHETRVERARRRERIERYCELMHDAYEQAAVGAGWETQQASRKPWADVPEANKATMRVAVAALLAGVEGEISQRLAECGARGRFGLQVVQHLDDWETS